MQHHVIIIPDVLPTLAQFVEPKGPATDVPAGEAPRDGQTTTSQDANGQGAPPGGASGSGNPSMMIIFALMMGVFFFVLMGGQRKEKKKRAKLLANVKKGDKVQTVGGILGTIVEMRENEVLLKVDENANTRIKFARSAIQSLASERSE